MTSENLEIVKSDDHEISSNDGEDKKFVSQAVAFMIGHARNGFVPLCASVATLLKEQARLKQELESVRQELFRVSSGSLKVNRLYEESVKKEVDVIVENQGLNTSEVPTTHKIPKVSEKAVFKHSVQHLYCVLKGCICDSCTEDEVHEPLIVPLNKGEKAVIRGEICGVVHYVGHVESLNFPEIYVGLGLSEPIGDSNGGIGNKKYFSVPRNHGIFVPLSHILCVMKNVNVNK